MSHSPPPSQRSINYDDLMHSLRLGLVRHVVELAAESGLPGGHYFQFTIRTSDPLTQLPDYLRQRYPDEIVLVLQHRFEHLKVSEQGFAVTLYFQGHPEQIFIPWTAILIFQDPSVPFGLQIQSPQHSHRQENNTPTPQSLFSSPTDLSSFSKTSTPTPPLSKPDTKSDKGQVIALDSHRVSKQTPTSDDNEPLT